MHVLVHVLVPARVGPRVGASARVGPRVVASARVGPRVVASTVAVDGGTGRARLSLLPFNALTTHEDAAVHSSL